MVDLGYGGVEIRSWGGGVVVLVLGIAGILVGHFIVVGRGLSLRERIQFSPSAAKTLGFWGGCHNFNGNGLRFVLGGALLSR